MQVSRIRKCDEDPLKGLRNVGKAALSDFALLGIHSRKQLAASDPDILFNELQHCTGERQDPCVRDVFAATIHECRTGEPLDWWLFTAERKQAGKDAATR